MAADILHERLAECARRTETALGRVLTDNAAAPPRLIAAMRHAALGGGKRLRPFLLAEAARLFGAGGDGPMRAGTAIECLHCYSLIHDDLPAMDDDDLRRGRPTVHRAFDEATAILAGDALLTLAFELLADPATSPDPAIRCDLVLTLARAAGVGGMAGGQMLDLAAEGRFAAGGRPLALGEGEIVRLQAMKTGALIRASVEMGAIIGHAAPARRAALAAYGRTLGAAFQIADDLLDLEGTPEDVGKATGKDAAHGKATLVSLWGTERARGRLADLVAEADAALADFGREADILRQAARYVAVRDR